MRGRAASPAVVVAVGTLAIGIGAAIGFLHGYLATALREDLGISRAQIGLLVSVYFGSTGLGSVGGGIISDRLGARLAVVADMAAVAAAGLLLVLWPSYPALLLASATAGLAYSMGNAGTNMAIGVAVAPDLRGLALTVKTAGVPAMATAAALLAPWGAERVGWRVVMGAVGVLAAAVAVLALAVLPGDRPAGPRAPRGSLPPGFAWFPVGAFLVIAGSQPLYSWSVSWFEEVHGTSVDAAGALSALGTAMGVVGMIAVGRRSDRLGGAPRTTVIAVMMLVCAGATLLLTAGTAVGLVVAAISLGVAMAAQLGSIGVMHAAVVDTVPDAIGRASGITMTGYYLGALLSPALFGLLIDTTGGYAVPWALGTACLLASAAAFRQAGRAIPLAPWRAAGDRPTRPPPRPSERTAVDELIIELRCNENTMRGSNPWLPYSPAEIEREAVDAWRAGASILHWHARDADTGAAIHDVAPYADVARRVRDATDLVLHPTLGYTTAAAVQDRVAHVAALADDPRLRIDMAPVDFGPVNVDRWDAAAGRFLPGDAVYANPRTTIEGTLRALDELRTAVATVCWDTSQVRTALRFREMGLLPARTLWELPFTGDDFPAGAAPEIHQLQAMVAALPAGEPWLVLCFNGDVTALAAWAMTMGGHVAIGTGDHPYDRLGAPGNGELVARIAAMGETLGRSIADPATTRRLLGLPGAPGGTAP